MVVDVPDLSNAQRHHENRKRRQRIYIRLGRAEGENVHDPLYDKPMNRGREIRMVD
jgi:hypothetical protein